MSIGKKKATKAKRKIMTLAGIEHHLNDKLWRLERDGDAGSAKVIDQLMKIRDMRAKEAQFAHEQDLTRIKPSVVVVPIIEDHDKWQEIAAQQQSNLIAQTNKIKPDS